MRCKRSALTVAILIALVFLFSISASAHNVSKRDAAFVQSNHVSAIPAFMYLGAKHMVTGYDHLAFLAGLLVVTSAGRLHSDWLAAVRARTSGDAAARSHVELLLDGLSPDAALVTVLDGHPATLSWLGTVAGCPVVPLGVEDFGQSGDIPDLYREYRLDVPAIVAAAARACLDRRARLEPRN